MNFITNRIPNVTGNGVTFDEYVDKLLKKSAEAEETEKKNYNINNDNKDGAGYQKGETQGKGHKPSVETMKDENLDPVEGKGKSEKEAKAKKETKVADCNREMGEANAAGKMVDNATGHQEQGNASEGPDAVRQQINAEPNYQTGESTAKPQGKKTEKSETKASVTSSFQKIASMKREDKIKTFAVLAANKNNPLAYVEAMVGLKWANMTDKEKEFVRKYWRTMFPDSYVEQMVKDR